MSKILSFILITYVMWKGGKEERKRMNSAPIKQ